MFNLKIHFLDNVQRNETNGKNKTNLYFNTKTTTFTLTKHNTHVKPLTAMASNKNDIQDV